MRIDDPAILITFDGKLAYVGMCPNNLYYARRCNDALFGEHETLANALFAAAELCGVVP